MQIMDYEQLEAEIAMLAWESQLPDGPEVIDEPDTYFANL